MNRTFFTAAATIAMALAIEAHGQTIIPAHGQTPEQIQADTAACQAQAKTAHDQAMAPASQSASSTASSAPKGGRARGAAVGAAAGAAAAEVRGNQYENYDKLPSEVQQEYRQNQAKDAAVAGAV